MIFAKDTGMTIIETRSSISENIEIEKFTKELSEKYKDVKIVFFKNK